MEKATTLNKYVRDAVSAVFEKQDAKKIKRHWNQSAHQFATYAATSQWFADKPESEAADFIREFGPYGFLGNASQFAQALGKLPTDDDLFLAARAAGALDLYS